MGLLINQWCMAQMLTLSTERFQKIQKEAPADCQHYLVQVTKYQAARNCKVSDYKEAPTGLIIYLQSFSIWNTKIKHEYLFVSLINMNYCWYQLMAGMDCWQMDYTKRATLGPKWCTFSSVCCATHLAFQKRLHLWWSCSHETTWWCSRAWLLWGN